MDCIRAQGQGLLFIIMLAIFLHPCFCEWVSPPTSYISIHHRFDGKAIDQAIAYFLMFLALIFTYFLH
ncbi:putative arabinogalactan protein/22/41 [Dioscorea sansibarensis]